MPISDTASAKKYASIAEVAAAQAAIYTEEARNAPEYANEAKASAEAAAASASTASAYVSAAENASSSAAAYATDSSQYATSADQSAADAAVSAANASSAATEAVTEGIDGVYGNLASTDSGKGASLSGFKQKGEGAVNTDADKVLNYRIVADNFGAKPIQEGDDIFDSGNAINLAIQEAVLRGASEVELLGSIYCSSVTITIPESITLIGQGGGRFAQNSTNINSLGTIILFTGTGEKNKTLDNVSDMSIGGGVILNPAYGASGASTQLSQYYKLNNYTNADAIGATMATLKQFSVGVHLTPGGGGGIRGIRVILGMPGTSSLDNYRNVSYNGLAENWDVGIWVQNRTQYIISDASAEGYWRLDGKLTSCVAVDSTAPSSEFGYIEKSFFQGFKGSSTRMQDSYKITSLTASTIEIGWSPSHRFPPSGILRSGSIIVTYTGLSFSGDKLTFTGCSDTSGLTAGSSTITNKYGVATGNFGMSGTSYIKCNFIGLGHASRLLATSPSLSSPFASASSFSEISGDSLREVRHFECTFLGSDEVAIHEHDCNDIYYTNCYGEGQTARSLINGSFDIPAGARFICSPFIGNNTRCTYPSGETTGMRDVNSDWNNSIDFYPQFDSTNVSRFVSDGGLYTPRTVINLSKGLTSSGSAVSFITPPGNSLTLGPRTSNAIITPNFGELDLRSISGYLVRIRVGSTTKMTLSDTAVVSTIPVNPSSDNALNNGQATSRWAATYSVKHMYTATVGDFAGSGSPEGAVTAGISSTYRRTDGAVGTLYYEKQSGTGNTGWVAK